MITQIVNMHYQECDVCIAKYPYSNPYKIGTDGTREEVVDKFRIYFFARIKDDLNFKEKVDKLDGRILGCWCKPRLCHGDIYVEYFGDKGKQLGLEF